MKVQSFASLMAEMKAVARGEKDAPADAHAPTVESVEVLARLLTADNRSLLKMIKDNLPQSIAELERLSGRKGPNLIRSLNKLEAVGLVRIHKEKGRRIPKPMVSEKLVVEIDPYAMNDRVYFA
jgi:predicted transcriptional regulator